MVTCLTRPNTEPASLQHLARLAEAGGEVIIYDLFPGRSEPRWLPGGVIYRPESKRGPLSYHLGLVYNRAIRTARGEVIAFVGDGVVCEVGCLRRHLEVRAIVGDALTVMPVRPVKPDSRRIMAASAIIPEWWLAENAPWALISDCWSAPAAALRRAKGWDPAACMAARGDEDLAWRLWSSGLPVLIDQGATAERLDLPRYPSSRWRGSPVDLLPQQRGGDYVSTWFKIMSIATAMLDHNRHHSKRAILGLTGLNHWQKQLSPAPRPTHTIALPVYSPTDVQNALAFTSDGAELLLLDRSPQSASHLVMAAAAVQGTRLIRDEFYLKASQLAVADVRLNHVLLAETMDTATRRALTSLQDETRKVRRELLGKWPKWLAEVARGDTVTFCHLSEQSGAKPQVFASLASVRNFRRAAPVPLSLPDDGWVRGPIHEGYANPPRAVAVRVTNRCNMRCRMCGQHGPAGNLVGVVQPELPLESLYALAAEAASARVGMFYIWGGEPLLRKDTLQLIDAAKRAGLFTILTTNGYFLSDVAEVLVDLRLDTLRLSLDGPPSVHDRIRGVPGLFDRVMSGVKALRHHKQRTGRELPVLELETTISPFNYTQLCEMVPIAVEAGAYALNYSHLVYATATEGLRRDAVFRELFNRPAWTWRGFCIDTEMDYEVLTRTIRLLQTQEQPLPIRFTPSLLGEISVKAHYTNPYAVYGRKACCAPWIWVEVHPDGQVYFCDDFHDISVGSLVNHRLRDIWNGDDARAYRRHLLAKGRFPGCITCGLLNMDGVY